MTIDDRVRIEVQLKSPDCVHYELAIVLADGAAMRGSLDPMIFCHLIGGQKIIMYMDTGK